MIKELKAAYDASTPGEWEQGNGSHATEVTVRIDGPQRQEVSRHKRAANAHFVALAHRGMPALLEAVELLKVAAHALETPGDFTPEEMQEQVIGDIGAFLAKLEAGSDVALHDEQSGTVTFKGVTEYVAPVTSQIEIEHWDSYRYKGLGHENSDVFVCEIDDRRAQSGQTRITIGAQSGHVDDFVDILAEINTLPGSQSAVPCFHVAADSDHMAFSVFQNGLGKFLVRLETGMQLLPTTLPNGEKGFVIQ